MLLKIKHYWTVHIIEGCLCFNKASTQAPLLLASKCEVKQLCGIIVSFTDFLNSSSTCKHRKGLQRCCSCAEIFSKFYKCQEGKEDEMIFEVSVSSSLHQHYSVNFQVETNQR